MSKNKPRRVNYRINYCSSQDPQYPVSQLVLQSVDSKGWQTKRFSQFPQTVIIQLLQLTTVTTISFLSHQTKISTKIDIFGREDFDDSWVKLGYTTLQSGVNTNYQSRQLRSVNLGGKVGIIALMIFGQKANKDQTIVRNKDGQAILNLNQLDRQTLMKFKNMDLLKKNAIQQNRFDDAQRIKEDIQSLQENVEALIILQKQKKQAIKRQNYQQAKQIVQRMKRLRGPMILPPKTPQSAFFDQNKSQDYISDRGSPKLKQQQNIQQQNYYQLPSLKQIKQSKSFDLNTFSPKKSVTIPFDQIKIVPKDRYAIDEFVNRKPQGNTKKLRPIQSRHSGNSSMYDEGQTGKNTQKLTVQQFEQCSKYFPVINEVTFQYIYSKDYRKRQKGIKILVQMMNNLQINNKKYTQQFISASIFIIKKLMDDNIVSILINIVDYFGMMMKKFKPSQIGQAYSNIKIVLQKLSYFLGHNNQKFKQQCQDVFASLPAHGLTNRELCLQILCKNNKQKISKVVNGKINMISRIAEKYKIGKNIQIVIQYTKAYIQDKNSQVRTSAIDLICILAKEIGYYKIHPFLQNIKTQTLKIIQQKIQDSGQTIDRNMKNFNYNQNSRQLPKNPQYYCDYCKIFDKRLQNQNFRDKHLLLQCKMITVCSECQQAVQVSSLNNHLLNQCQNHKYYKKCPKCKEAIQSKQYNTHTKLKDCLTAKAPALANRCPLCHDDIEPGQQGWIKHLVNEQCPNNRR